MSVKTKKEQIVFSGDLTIHHAGELQKELKKHIAAHDHISIAFETIDSIDLSFLQLMCSVHRESLKKEKSITITTSVPEQLRQIMATIGFERTISCDHGEHDDCLWKAITEAEKQ
ncbi:MAG: STAS domain-containing protein [Spirochaetales bacterium]|nr:STAS domain-containing protein [Spirochaetales bacterium]